MTWSRGPRGSCSAGPGASVPVQVSDESFQAPDLRRVRPSPARQVPPDLGFGICPRLGSLARAGGPLLPVPNLVEDLLTQILSKDTARGRGQGLTVLVVAPLGVVRGEPPRPTGPIIRVPILATLSVAFSEGNRWRGLPSDCDFLGIGGWSTHAAAQLPEPRTASSGSRRSEPRIMRSTTLAPRVGSLRL